MRVLLQRVRWARVRVGGEEVAATGPGLLALVGVGSGDDADEARRMARKTARLRLFAGGERGFEHSVGETGGEVMCVSQFTLMGDVRRGNRPSWSAAARPEDAAPLVDAYADALEEEGVRVGRGVFGAMMDVALENDGPVTIMLDTGDLDRPRRGEG
ncbi:MAG: D-aminoacyl-tRNA deacylase [Thermoleophilia bacterium]|jgi:D-tyrosyl-tRNA(Tyr) deacylase|nr:D-aminoacyl-tRNA deacylase [Thermoleophilia bacterium]